MTLFAFSTAAKNAMVDALLGLCDLGGTNATGDIAFYDAAQANQLARIDDARAADPNFRIQIPMWLPAGTGGNPAGVASLNMLSTKVRDDNNNPPFPSGVVAVAHIRDRNNAHVFKATCGTNPPGGFDIIFNTTQISSGNPVEMTSFTVTSP